MPGILPMKVIKVGSGNSSQTRIAQACDRCRSKKIRCDGVRPCCTQCANVGFECKTSDKLSRRAFPRGYTESLEERVRSLETEIRELKELLDEKDEKIDLLSRIHANSQSLSPVRRPSALPSPAQSTDSADQVTTAKDDLFKVQQSPFLLEGGNADSYFMGTSSGRALVDAFKRKVQESGKSCCEVDTEDFFAHEQKGLVASRASADDDSIWRAPPRLQSDQLINVFFQEWACLFPVLHRPSFLSLYEEYVSEPEAMNDKKSLAQLNLVFGIAAVSGCEPAKPEDLESFEVQWQTALESIMMENSLTTLQCLILAQIYCIQKGDYTRLLNYKGLAIGLSQRLGLHQPQKRFALGALTCETRKKVFWTLYTLDCFSAAVLGLPKTLKEEDIHCEYPVDADDEYITEKGFLPTLPGESTKVSSALALFRASRILSKVLEENYPASASHELSFANLAALSNELEAWLSNLAPHLRLVFAQDKPSTNVTSSRSPILSMVYHYIRSLIHRPAVCASLGGRSSSSIVALATSSKSIIQIVQLLEERRLSFSLCLNKNELFVLSGFGLLFQCLDCNEDGKVMKDSQKMIRSVTEMLGRWKAPSAPSFRKISSIMVPVSRSPRKETSPPTVSRSSTGSSTGSRSPTSMPAPTALHTSAHQQLKAIASRFSGTFSKHPREELKESRRATAPEIPVNDNLSSQHRSSSHTSLSSIRSEPARSEPMLSPSQLSHSNATPVPQQIKPLKRRTAPPQPATTNLDYLSFGNEQVLQAYPNALRQQTTAYPIKPELDSTDWEKLLSNIDSGQTSIYNSIYGGSAPNHPSLDSYLDLSSTPIPDAQNLTWSPSVWTLSLDNAAHNNNSGSPITDPLSMAPAPAGSVLSFSDESLTSGEDFANCDFASTVSGNVGDHHRGIMVPNLSPGGHMGSLGLGLDDNEMIGLAGLDGVFGL